MEMRHLRYFIAVAEELHFGRAAERLSMAQPPLSQAIRQVERELGVELLTRTTRHVALTEAGRAYLERARLILADVDAASDHVRRVGAGSVGRVRIGCVGSATYSFIPALSRRLAEVMPDVDFSFRGEMLAPDQAEALRTHAIDVALLRPPVLDTSLAVTTLRRDGLVVAVPAGHRLARQDRVTVGDLDGEPLIVHSAGRRSTMYGVVLGLLRDAGIEARVRHEVGETSTLVTLVAGGLGVAVVPEPVTALRIAGVVYRTLVGAGGPTVELCLAHRAGGSEAHLARTVEVITRLAGADRVHLPAAGLVTADGSTSASSDAGS